MIDSANVLPIKISKLEAARRQLITAIRLYFSNGDVISTHTLAAAALEILGDLDEHGPNSGTLLDLVEKSIKPEFIDLFRKSARRPQNFFKHADNDPEDILEYYPSHAEMILWAATEKYFELTNETLLETSAIRTWIIIRRPDLLLQPRRDHVEGLRLGHDFGPDDRYRFFEQFSIAYGRTINRRLKP